MKTIYYAQLNDNNICTMIVSSKTPIVGSSKHIEIPEYNESLYYYRKYDPITQWSGETYEPSVDTILQDKVDSFEALVEEQNLQLATMKESNNVLNIDLEKQRLLLDEMLFEILPGLMG